MSKKRSFRDDAPQVRKNLHELVINRGYGDYADQIVDLVFLDYVISKSENISDRALELAELIAFIRSTKSDAVKLSDTDELKVKYAPNYTIIGSSIVKECEQWATTLLNTERGGYYEDIGIPDKEIEDFDIISYVELYTDDELAQILSFERKSQKIRSSYNPKTKYAGRDEFKNPYYGRILKGWYDWFSEIGIFKSAIHIEQGGMTRKGYRQECEFLYDCMAIIGMFKPIDVEPEDEKSFRDEKYDRVKNCINSYEKHVMKEKNTKE